MATTHSANDLKVGLKILLENKPCVILESEFVKPGKGQAFTRIRYRELQTNKVLDRTFRSSDKVAGADVLDLNVNFMYADGESAHFMDPVTYEQYEVKLEVAGEPMKWVQENSTCVLTLLNNEPIVLMPPNFIEVAVEKTDPGVKGDTVTGGSKPATLVGGAVIEVPLFIDQGQILRVDTRTGVYVSKAKS